LVGGVGGGGIVCYAIEILIACDKNPGRYYAM